MDQVNLIMTHVAKLPVLLQSEVLDYVEFLEQKISKTAPDFEDWPQLSIKNALRRMEDEVNKKNEKVEYLFSDIKEK